jgi:plasmid stabilization system protein ParE
MKVVFAERARRDIGEIFDVIAAHDPRAAQRVEDAIRRACEWLGDFPRAAAATDEPNVRRFPLVRYPYTIYYRFHATRGRVEIARVIHAARIRNLV